MSSTKRPKESSRIPPRPLCALCILLFAFAFFSHAAAQQTPEPSDFPAQFDLLDTKVRFESSGDSRKEVHAIVKIHSELGVRQFATLTFDFNRSFQSVEIPLVRVTHASGGTADILPSAITDNPNPAVVNFPAYHDVRVKSVRILGLAPGDTLEYRVITTSAHPPLAPDFWLDHSFDRSGVVSQEIFELDLPADRKPQLRISSETPAQSSPEMAGDRLIYRWNRHLTKNNETEAEASGAKPDIVLTSFRSWEELADHLENRLEPTGKPAADVFAKASALAKVSTEDPAAIGTIRCREIYDFVSQKIKTVDLPLGSTGFRTRSPSQILVSGYGTPEDKHKLFAAMANSFFGPARAGLISTKRKDVIDGLPEPSVFDHLLTMTGWLSISFWLDLNVEVAPYQVIPLQFRKRLALVAGPAVSERWRPVDDVLPFLATQTVMIDAQLDKDGALSAKVRYRMRGDNELLLRLAFHQSPREKWPVVAQLLALSDGFRGRVTSVSASDPYATRDPFKVEYEIRQPKFVDWTKSPVRIPAILPLVGLPDAPAFKSASGSQTTAEGPIELGTPLDVNTSVTLHLPSGTTIESPAGTTVERDYATFSSTYAATGGTIAASRHLRFIARELPADRSSDYNALVHAVQNDQAQRFTLFAPPARQSPSKSKPQANGRL